MRSLLKIGILVVIFLSVADLAAAQCAMCKAVVESAENGSLTRTGTGLNKGILYLMAFPYILLFLIFRKKIVAFLKAQFAKAA
ncbi:MAG: hypothetical protein ACXITV_08830 [Luteibaculaceae bacterium]